MRRSDFLLYLALAAAITIAGGLLIYSFPVWLDELAPKGQVTLNIVSGLFENLLIAVLIVGIISHLATTRASRRAAEEARKEQDTVRAAEAERNALESRLVETIAGADRAIYKAAAAFGTQVQQAFKIVRDLATLPNPAEEIDRREELRAKLWTVAESSATEFGEQLALYEFKHQMIADILVKHAFDLMQSALSKRETLASFKVCVDMLGAGIKEFAQDEDLRLFLAVGHTVAERLEPVVNDLAVAEQSDRRVAAALRNLHTGVAGFVAALQRRFDGSSDDGLVPPTPAPPASGP